MSVSLSVYTIVTPVSSHSIKDRLCYCKYLRIRRNLRSSTVAICKYLGNQPFTNRMTYLTQGSRQLRFYPSGSDSTRAAQILAFGLVCSSFSSSAWFLSALTKTCFLEYFSKNLLFLSSLLYSPPRPKRNNFQLGSWIEVQTCKHTLNQLNLYGMFSKR